MKTSPNIGLVYPDSDNDAFDELVYKTAFDLIDQLLGAPLAYAEVQAAANFPADGSIATIVQTPLATLPLKPLRIRCFLPTVQVSAGAGGAGSVELWLYDDTANVQLCKIGRLALSNMGANYALTAPVYGSVKLTPPAAGDRRYSLRGQIASGSTVGSYGGGTGVGGALAPGFLSVAIATV